MSTELTIPLPSSLDDLRADPWSGLLPAQIAGLLAPAAQAGCATADIDDCGTAGAGAVNVVNLAKMFKGADLEDLAA